MVVQLLILPVGFGRFFPRWQMVRKRTFIAESTSGNGPSSLTKSELNCHRTTRLTALGGWTGDFYS
jgi:hypothetical protein